MKDTDEADLQAEIDRISATIKKTLKKIDAVVPLRPEDTDEREPSSASGEENTRDR